MTIHSKRSQMTPKLFKLWKWMDSLLTKLLVRLILTARMIVKIEVMLIDKLKALGEQIF